MIEGLLTVNLEPPYLSFQSLEDLTAKSCLRYCTAEDVKSALANLCAFQYFQHWPLKECIIRVEGSFSREKLAHFGLLPFRLVSLPEPERALNKPTKEVVHNDVPSRGKLLLRDSMG